MKFFNKKQEKNVYGTHTIREFLQIVEETMKENPKITLDSPILISDFSMSGFKEEFKVQTTVSPYGNTMGLCLFHSLGEKVPVQEVEVAKELEEEELEINEENMVELVQVTNDLKSLDDTDREVYGDYKPSLLRFVDKYGRK